MSPIVASIVFSLVLILILVTVLLVAKAKLLPSGKVKLLINGKKEIEVETGNTLLTTLGNEKIFLPSACGGGLEMKKYFYPLLVEVEAPVYSVNAMC